METKTEVTISAIDVRALSAEELAAFTAFQNARRTEGSLTNGPAMASRPEDPPTTVEEFGAMLANIPSFVRVWAWLGRDERGQVVCGARLMSFDTGDNPHVAQVDIGVLSEWRRQGAGRRLLREIVE